MKKTLFFIFLATTAVVVMMSCSNSDDNKHLVPIRSVTATSSVDLSNRADWHFTVGAYAYNYKLTGNEIYATPKSKHEMTYADKNTFFTDNGLRSQSYYDVRFFSPKDPFPIESFPSLPSVTEVEVDQTTEEKIFNADSFSWHCRFDDIAEHAKAALKYERDLVDFNFIDLPQGATFQLEEAGRRNIKPYTHEGQYKAIVPLAQLIKIVVVVGDISYNAELWRALMQQRIAIPISNMHYTFSVRYNKDEADDTKVLTIENITKKERALDVIN